MKSKNIIVFIPQYLFYIKDVILLFVPQRFPCVLGTWSCSRTFVLHLCTKIIVGSCVCVRVCNPILGEDPKLITSPGKQRECLESVCVRACAHMCVPFLAYLAFGPPLLKH